MDPTEPDDPDPEPEAPLEEPVPVASGVETLLPSSGAPPNEPFPPALLALHPAVYGIATRTGTRPRERVRAFTRMHVEAERAIVEDIDGHSP
jgi:hypothetical protein